MQHHPQNIHVAGPRLGLRDARSFEEASAHELGAGHQLSPSRFPHLEPRKVQDVRPYLG